MLREELLRGAWAWGVGEARAPGVLTPFACGFESKLGPSGQGLRCSPASQPGHGGTGRALWGLYSESGDLGGPSSIGGALTSRPPGLPQTGLAGLSDHITPGNVSVLGRKGGVLSPPLLALNFAALPWAGQGGMGG